MDEAIIETFDNVKFIKGQTRLNQANWQEYFGSFLPNGVYEGLEVTNQVDGVTGDYRYLTDGAVFVNGIYAKLETENGYTDIGGYFNDNPLDRLICIRVYFDEERAEVIQKTNVASESTQLTEKGKVLDTLNKLIYDESYCCERNNFYWDIPIFYQGKRFGNGTTEPYQTELQPGRSLRRVVDLSNKVERIYITNTNNYPGILISGGNSYRFSADTDTPVRLYMDTLPDSSPRNAYVYCRMDAGATLRLQRWGWLNDYRLHTNTVGPGGTYNKTRFVISDPTGWSWGPGSTEESASYDYYTASSRTILSLRFSEIHEPIGSSWDYYSYLVEVLQVGSW